MINKSDLKVGVFVLLGLVLGALVVFLIGSERRVFESAVEYKSSFEDVGGLKPGAPVSMGGVRIGKVEAVQYGESNGADCQGLDRGGCDGVAGCRWFEDDSRCGMDDQVHVVLEIVASEAVRVRGGWQEKDGERVWVGTKARIVPKGLLGDMQMELTKGEGEQLEAGTEIPGEPLEDMLGSIGGLAGEAKKTINDVGVVAEKLGDEQLHQDIRESARSMNVLLKELTEGEGYPRRFLSDPKEAERISRAIESFEQTAGELNHTLREVRLTAARIRTGPGFAHDVIYGDGPKKEIAQFGMAAEEVAITLKGIREGDGFAHDVLFGGEGDTGDAMKNVTQITADLRDIVRNVKEGKGTIGALLVDPSVYEDVKRLLGNVGRNNVLRALVRYSIKKDDKAPSVEVDGGSE